MQTITTQSSPHYFRKQKSKPSNEQTKMSEKKEVKGWKSYP